jgi:hypothetical protein
MAQILNTGYQRSSKNSRVVVGGENLKNNKWTAEETGDDLDTVNFESSGLDEGIKGIFGVAITYGGDWDAAYNFFDDPPGIYPRDDLQDLQLYLNVADDTFWDFYYSRINSCNNSSSVRDKVSFDASGKSQGDYTRPTGSV